MTRGTLAPQGHRSHSLVAFSHSLRRLWPSSSFILTFLSFPDRSMIASLSVTFSLALLCLSTPWIRASGSLLCLSTHVSSLPLAYSLALLCLTITRAIADLAASTAFVKTLPATSKRSSLSLAFSLAILCLALARAERDHRTPTHCNNVLPSYSRCEKLDAHA